MAYHIDRNLVKKPYPHWWSIKAWPMDGSSCPISRMSWARSAMPDHQPQEKEMRFMGEDSCCVCMCIYIYYICKSPVVEPTAVVSAVPKPKVVEITQPGKCPMIIIQRWCYHKPMQSPSVNHHCTAKHKILFRRHRWNGCQIGQNAPKTEKCANARPGSTGRVATPYCH